MMRTGKWSSKNRQKNNVGNALFVIATMILLSGCDSRNLKRLDKKCANAGPYNIQDQKLWEGYVEIHENFYRKKIDYYIKNKEAQIGLMVFSNLKDDLGGTYFLERKDSASNLGEIYREDYTLIYRNSKKHLYKKIANLENYNYMYHDQFYSANKSIDIKNCVQHYASAYLGEIMEEINERR